MAKEGELEDDALKQALEVSALEESHSGLTFPWCSTYQQWKP